MSLPLHPGYGIVIQQAQNRRKFLVEDEFALNWRPPSAD
jgi:hypothetical protein